MDEKLNGDIENALNDSPYNFEIAIKIPNKDKLESIREKVRQELGKILANNQIIIGTTGSDGREENLPNSSKLDLIVYFQWEGNLWSEIVGTLKKIEPSVEDVEVVRIEEVRELLYYWGIEIPKFFPTRFLDFNLLGWDEEMLRKLWKLFVESLRNVPSKKYSSFVERLRTHKKALREGYSVFKGQRLIHFDPSFEKIFYDRLEGIERWVKISHLRPVQYRVAHELFKLVRQWRIYNIEDLLELEKSIDKKISFLVEEYSMDIPPFLVESYIGFLWVHLLTKGAYRGWSLVIYPNEFVKEKLKRYHSNLRQHFG